MTEETTISKPLSKKAIRKAYEEIRPNYVNLGKNIKTALMGFMHEKRIDVLDVCYRVKEFESFYDKIGRKKYTNPFSEIEDICGLRIICFLPADLDLIIGVIEDEFFIAEREDKSDMLSVKEFGYRSLHFIVKLKDDWLKAPNFRGLKNFKAEIQVRTILMHAWADISHKLSYKQEESVPNQLKRKLSQLCALFELADEQFDELWQSKTEYQNDIAEVAKERGRFDITQPLNIDTLQTLLDFYFPERKMSSLHTLLFYQQIKVFNITIKELVESVEQSKDILVSFEAEMSKIRIKPYVLSQIGAIRIVLNIFNDEFYRSNTKRHRIGSSDLIDMWRKKLTKEEK